MTQISPTFLKIIKANIKLWLRRTEQLADADLENLHHKYLHLERAVKLALALPELRNEETAVLTKQSYLLVERYGHWDSWLPIINRVINECVEDNPSLLFDLLIQKGVFLRLHRQLDHAILVHQDAKVIAQQLDNQICLAEVHIKLSVDYRLIRNYDLAQEYGLLALNLAQKMNGLPEILATILNTLGLIVLDIGKSTDLIIAEKRFKESAAIYRKIKSSPTLIARTMINLAVTLQEQNKIEEAIETYLEAEQLLNDSTSGLDQFKLYNSRGTLYFKLAQWKNAEASFRKANSKQLVNSGDIFTRASLNHNLGNVLLKQGRVEEAETFLREGAKLWKQVNDPVWFANALGALGEVLGLQKQFEKAIHYYERAIVKLKSVSSSNETSSRLIGEFDREKAELIRRKKEMQA